MKNIFIICCCLFFTNIKAQTFTGTTGGIFDNGTLNTYTSSVSGLPTVIDTNFGLLTVCVNITHTWNSDLNVSLVSPNGQSFILFNGIGGADDNFTNTCLNHLAINDIINGTAPFTGTFKPMGRIGAVNDGSNPNGIWKLEILDTYAFADSGTVLSWSINFGANAQGPYTFSTTNLPLVKINTVGGASINNSPKVNGTMKIIDNASGINNYNDSATIETNIAIEIRGNYSSILPQKPYEFETRNALNQDSNVSIFGLPAESDWLLIANYNDKAFSRNPLANHLFEKMGHYASRGKLCEVIINNNYQGIYYLCEKIKRDNDRVNIAKLDSSDNTGLDVTGGYIWKNDFGGGWTSPYHPIGFPAYNVNFAFHYPKQSSITTFQANYIESFVTQAESILYNINFKNPTTGYRAYLDMPSFYDYFIVNELSRNNDGFKKSVYFHKGKNTATQIAKIKMGPVWDFDWAWKNINECVYGVQDGSQWTHLVNNCGPDNPSAGWYVRLLQDSNFANELNCRYVQLRSTVLDTAYIFNYIDSVAQAVNVMQAQNRHYTQWPHLGYNSGAPENDSFPTTYIGEVKKLKKWIEIRINWLDSNMFGNANNCSILTSKKSITEQRLVFPNPAKDVVYVETELINGSIQVINMLGQIVYSQQVVNKGSIPIDVSKWNTGIYHIIITNNDGKVSTHKLLVE